MAPIIINQITFFYMPAYIIVHTIHASSVSPLTLVRSPHRPHALQTELGGPDNGGSTWVYNYI